MPEIIPESRGRTPLPESEKKKPVCYRISRDVLEILNAHVSKARLTNKSYTKNEAVEKALRLLDI